MTYLQLCIPNNVNLDAFLNSLNNLSPSIKFTTEREANSGNAGQQQQALFQSVS